MFPTTWRLPTEAKTPILVITDGCSYGKCSFCSLYSRKKFRKIPWVDLVKQIDFMKEKISQYQSYYKTIAGQKAIVK